jgi:hypothetical protein
MTDLRSSSLSNHKSIAKNQKSPQCLQSSRKFAVRVNENLFERKSHQEMMAPHGLWGKVLNEAMVESG